MSNIYFQYFFSEFCGRGRQRSGFREIATYEQYNFKFLKCHSFNVLIQKYVL